MQCASVRLREPAIAINLLRFTNQWRKLESIKTPHSIVVKVFLSCPPATKLSHFARYGFEGSRPGRSIIAAIELLRRLNTPNQPTFENGHVTTFRNCHYKAWHSHRLGQTSLARRIHPASLKLLLTWQKFTGLGSFPQGTCIVDGYDLILTASHVAPTTDLKGDWTSTCHQTRRKAQLFSFSPCHNSKGASPGEIWREQYDNNIQKRPSNSLFALGSLTCEMTSGAGGERILQLCALKSSQIWTCCKHEMQKLWAANIFQSNSKGQRRMSWLIVAQNLSYNRL